MQLFSISTLTVESSKQQKQSFYFFAHTNSVMVSSTEIKLRFALSLTKQNTIIIKLDGE